MDKVLYCITVVTFTAIGAACAQPAASDSTLGNATFQIGAYIDMYYGVLTDGRSGDVPYFVSMSRSNELTINLAFIDVKYHAERFRARFTPAVGTFMNANYAAEPGTLKNILEASAGFQLSQTKNIWLDAGILGSPYTNESPISREQLMYTRSFAPEYVPYYLAGLKLSLPLSNQVTTYLYLLNGWQQIADPNRQKSVGTQLEWKPSEKHLLNWNTYIGDERSSSAPDNRMRYFTDVYWLYNLSGGFSFTTCVYIGNQKRQRATGELSNNFWWQANFIARYRLSKGLSVSGRLEYFSDPASVQISPIHPSNGFASYSSGVCLNWQVNRLALFRAEGRHFFSDRQVYDNGNAATSKMTWLITSMTIGFPK
ncbi:MAG: outer membrane beta-barrel protein [Cytophagales bacterium]|nr:porin [Bernardetiaceae bacterium]MDW8204740.1 outer membrane beta-barrel protein [Cytophagales bacterium]